MPGILFSAKEDPVPFGDMIPLKDGELPTSAVMGIAWDNGYTRGVTSSIARWGEQFGAEQGIGEALNDIYKPPKLDKLDPKIANERYGIPGALSFSSPIRESVAQILRERKDTELAQQYLLDKTKGLQKAGVFTAQLAAGVLDPAALMAGFIPIVPEATYAAWANRSLLGARAGAGALEGAVGNALVEPIIYGQAQYEQAQYGPWDSLANIVAGGVLGTGLHVVGGRLVDWMHGVQMKNHLKALQTAINQMGDGQKVEVNPILGAETVPDNSVKVNFDEIEEVKDPSIIYSEDIFVDTKLYGGYKIQESPDFPGTYNLYDPNGGIHTGFADTHSATLYLKQLANKVQSEEVPAEVILSDEDPVLEAFNFVEANKGEELFIYLKDGNIIKTTYIGIGQASGSVAYTTANNTKGGILNIDDIHSIVNHNPKIVAPSTPPIQVAPLVGDTTDGLDVFNATNNIEALNLDNLVPEGVGQLGSNNGDVHTDAASGKKFYVKLPPPEKVEQARQEYVAFTFYKMAGQDVPDIRPVLKDGEFVGVASEWVENAHTPKTQAELYKKLAEYKQKDPLGFEKFSRGIIIDMWLANWDWAAAGNIIFTPEGVPMRIDFGGTLQYRAMGSKKQAEDFSEVVTELKSFLDPASVDKAKIHNTAAWNVIQIAGEDYRNGVNDLALITDDDISASIWKMGLSADDAAELSGVLIARRLAIMEKYAAQVDPTLLKSAEFFSNTQAEQFLEKMAGTWKALSKAASEKLSSYKGNGYTALNEWLRGAKNAAYSGIEKMRDAMDAAVQGFAFPQEAYLWRGGVPKSVFKELGITIHDDVATIRKKLLSNGIGHTISDPAFLSTSLSKSFALSWGAGGDRIGLRIKVPKGQTAAIPLGNMKHVQNNIYASDSEYEFILPRDTHLVITDVYKDKASGQTIVNTKVVPHNKIKPVKAEQAMSMAEKHFKEFSSAADENVMDAELTYSLKESMKIDEADDLVSSIDKNSSEVLQDIKKSALDDEATLNTIKQIEETHGIMQEQSNAMAKGAMAAYGCVLKNANL